MSEPMNTIKAAVFDAAMAERARLHLRPPGATPRTALARQGSPVPRP